MITDARRRFALAANRVDATCIDLLQHDSRWRTTKTFVAQIGADSDYSQLDLLEGNAHFAVIERDNQSWSIRATLRSVLDPDVVLATGVFASGCWTFAGNNQVWSHLPEYLLVRNSGTTGVLRIADGQSVVELPDVEDAFDVIAVPKSPLVVIARIGGMLIFDLHARRAVRSQQLKEGNSTPVFRFRDPDELWVNDVTSMLKLDRKFKVVDAAGSELEAEVDSQGGIIASWTFGAESELCVVTRSDMGDVVVLDVATMLPVAHAVFPAGVRPVEAALCGRRSIVAKIDNASMMQRRLRRPRFH